MSADIANAAKPLQDAWPLIKNDFINRNAGKYLSLSCVYRSPETQFEFFKKGRTMDTQGKWVISDQSQVITNVDGHTVLGAHNYFPSRAIDVTVFDNQTGQPVWEESNYYCLLEIAKGVSLESGGGWHSLKDWPHLQIPNYQSYVE